jgi:negative regulator of flagellin synthesis FlgM
MKINDTQRIGVYRAYQQTLDQRVGKTSGQRRKDEVNFSAEAMELLSARSQDVDQVERAQRIERLKVEVSSGTYRIPDHVLAEKLLPFVR